MSSGWTDAEKAAMKERADELRAEKGGKKLLKKVKGLFE